MPAGEHAVKPPLLAMPPSRDARHILVINSYHPGYSWSDNEMNGIIETFRKADQGIGLIIEYLDTKRYPRMEHFDRMRDLFQQKYPGKNFLVVIAADNPALAFALKYRSVLFPGASIVFCGINGFNKKMIEGHENVTGVAEVLDADGTMKTALELHPGTREVVVVHDYSITGLSSRRETEEQLKSFAGKVSFTFMENMPLQELMQRLKKLPPDSLVLGLSYSMDKNGEVINHEEISKLLGKNSPVPVYGVHEERIGYGIVGGNLQSGELQGTRAAEMAIEILSGKPASNIPVDLKSPVREMFDYNQLIRFNIPLKALPKEGIIVNRPVSFFSRYSGLVIAVLAIILTLITGLIILAFNIYKRMTAEQALLESENRYRKLFESSKDAVYITSREGPFVAVNQSILDLFGYTREEITGLDIRKIYVNPEERLTFQQDIESTGYLKDYEIKFRKKNGIEMDCLLTATVLKDDRGNILGYQGIIRDITAQKLTEHALMESEKRFRQMAEDAPIAIGIIDKNGNIEYVNKEHVAMVGYTHGDIPTLERWWALAYRDEGMREKTTNEWNSIADKLYSGEWKSKKIERRIVCKDNTVKDVELMLSQAGDKVLVVFHDITERKKAENALKEKEYLLSESQRIAHIGSWGWDLTGPIKWSDETYRIYGVSPDTFTPTSESLVNLLHPEDRPAMQRWIEACGAGQSPDDLEFRVILPDGSVRRLSGRGELIYDSENRPTFMAGTVQDITERKKMEEKYYQISQDWEDTFNSITDMVTVHDNEFNILHANKAAEKILGLPLLEKDAETKCFTYYHGTKEPPKGCLSCDCLKTGQSAIFELFEPHLNMFIEVRAIPRFDSNNNQIGLIHVVRDITEHKKLEDQLRHSQKMEAVGTLAGGIAHDFNNILNVILGYGSMVMDKLEANSPLKEQMNEVLTAADRAATLTRRLLVFSRKQVIDVKPVNVNEIIVGMQKMLGRIIRENISFSMTIADRPLMVLADAGQIEQVLMNLVTNARDAMPEGGRLTIGTGLEEFDAEYVAACGYGKPGTYALITVADTGQGMDEETQKKIFEPFFTTKGIGEGTGLGLAISYGIIKQHNGYIKVYSEPGQGTEFKICLPLIGETAAPGKKTEIPDPARSGNETILVAEDDAALRKLTSTVLEALGYTVILAEDGEEAITKFMENREKIALVVLDMIMPKKNGKEAYEEIRKTSPSMKSLFMSGYTMDIIKIGELTEAGFDFIQKPVLPSDLLKKVREILDR